MKKLFSALLTVVLMLSCFVFTSSAVTYDAAKYKGGYVATKIVKKNSYGETTTINRTFNSKGYLTKEVVKDNYDTETTSFTYDSKGKLTKSASKNNSYGKKRTITYNSNGTVRKDYTSANINEYWDTLIADNFTYNKSGQLTKSQEGGYDADDTTTYSYNSNGQIVKTTSESVFVDGKFVKKYTYDKNGRLTKLVESGSYRNNTFNYSYNSKGQMIKGADAYGNGISKCTYNDKGDITKIVYANGSSETYSYTYKKVASTGIVINGKIHLQYSSTSYTGSAKKPTVTIDGMRNGVEYKVSYSNNVKQGKGKVKITFLGENATQAPVSIAFDIRPATPKDVKASGITKSSTKLTWTKSAGATGYIIYKYIAAEKKYVKLAQTTATSYTVKNLKSGTTYKFAVKAYTKGSSANIYSGYSSLVTVKTK